MKSQAHHSQTLTIFCHLQRSRYDHGISRPVALTVVKPCRPLERVPSRAQSQAIDRGQLNLNH